MELAGAVCLVTGASSGIGRATAQRLVAQGAEVLALGRNANALEATGGRPIVCDLTDDEAVERAVAAAGPVDVLVNNAGIGFAGPLAELDRETLNRLVRVNLVAPVLLTRAFLPGMLERGRGRIVITGSGAAYLPGSSHTAYPASKAAVCRYGETLAKELEGRVPVFFFSPGLVKTEMTSWAPDDAPWTPPELAPRLVARLATGRYDALAGRYLHAEHDDLDDLLARIDEVREQDLNAIRLRR